MLFLKDPVLRRRIRTWVKSSPTWLPLTVARHLICMYFINHGFTHLYEHWYLYGAISFPVSSIPMIVAGIIVASNIATRFTAIPLVAFAFLETIEILAIRVWRWLFVGETLYLNELMVKKFSTLGCSIMIIVNDPGFSSTVDQARQALSGLITDDDDGGAVSKLVSPGAPRRVTHKTSAVLLAVRLCIAILFIFVGYSEILRQIASGQYHQRPPGDGHDQLWLKVVQFVLAVPFVAGFKTRAVAALLALACAVESVIYWRWWNTLLGIPYELHARDHFWTNFAVAGGLWMLQSFGPGQYSVDELLKKKEK